MSFFFFGSPLSFFGVFPWPRRRSAPFERPINELVLVRPNPTRSAELDNKLTCLLTYRDSLPPSRMKASPDVEDGDGGDEFGDGPPVVVVDGDAVPSGLVLTETAFVVTERERRRHWIRERGEQAEEQRELVEATGAEAAAAGAAAAAAADMARTPRNCCGLAALVVAFEAAAAGGDEAAADARMFPFQKNRAREMGRRDARELEARTSGSSSKIKC